ncbi:MAG TPA: NAD-dependent epimerase/dehydratase family protein [Limnobacter sp.]|uniref:NAD-dependent epimerase/dehydratase family protein n=1 Tax=Limnobacter sp. TaxID=2003368 RepID=UPI002E315908|nr:NAD-dependent epimerase/dehydratase family protein [Limnobacter sp.]HEX5485817.1 NAD-dependent epimerase/dehydratase family protein [Limnobacter sp.]
MATFLITGATGFVGQALTKSLCAQGETPRLLVRTLQPDLPNNLQQCVMRSIDDHDAFAQACQGVDVIVHLGGLAHITDRQLAGQDEPYEQINHQWTSHLAKAAITAGVGRFVLISSIGVVATQTAPQQVLKESDTCQPVNPYGRSKLAAEQTVQNLCRNTSTSWCILRPPLVHGKGAPGNLRSMARWLTRELPLPFASVKNRRSLVHINNLIQAIELAARHPAASGEVFHLSDGVDRSTPEILRQAAGCLGVKVRLFSFPVVLLRWIASLVGKSGMVNQLTADLVVDCSKIQYTLGYKPVNNPIEV